MDANRDQIFAELDSIRKMQIDLAKEHLGIEMLSSEGVSFELFMQEKHDEASETKASTASGFDGFASLNSQIPGPIGEDRNKRHTDRVSKKHTQVKQLSQKLELLGESM